MRPSKFVFYIEWLRTMDDAMLSKAERSRLIDAIVTYADTGIVPTLPRLLTAIFSPIKGTLDRDMEKYNDKVEKLKENGRKGGRPKTNQNQTKANGFPEKQMGGNNINIHKHIDITYPYAAEPTEEEKNEIYLVFFWRNLTEPEAELNRFFDYNAQRKWKALDTPSKRMAAAAEWQPQDSKPRVRQEFLNMWYKLYCRLKKEGEGNERGMIDCRARFEFQGNEAKLRIRSKALRGYIEDQQPPEILDYIGTLRLTTAAP